MRISSMILMALLAVPAPALAQTEPFLTEQATTGPAGRLSLETAAGFMASEPNFRTGLETRRPPRSNWTSSGWAASWP